MRSQTLFVFALGFAAPAVAQVGFNGPGRYEIVNVDTGKLLGLDLGDRSSVVQFSTPGLQHVVWEFQPAGEDWFYIRNALSGGGLTAVTDRNTAPVTASRFTGAPNQQWRIEPGKDGNPLIVSRTGKALDIPGGDHSDGVRVQVHDRNGDATQRFILRPVEGEFHGPPGLLQGPYGQQPRGSRTERVVRCSSEDGRRNNCVVDTSGGVRMLRQIGGSPCVEGETWGWDRRGIWVDRGCRADFDVGAKNLVTCASDDGHRNYCRAETARGVRMVRQIGASPCRQGETWGWDRGGVWVDRGCRAEFEVGGP